LTQIWNYDPYFMHPVYRRIPITYVRIRVERPPYIQGLTQKDIGERVGPLPIWEKAGGNGVGNIPGIG